MLSNTAGRDALYFTALPPAAVRWIRFGHQIRILVGYNPTEHYFWSYQLFLAEDERRTVRGLSWSIRAIPTHRFVAGGSVDPATAHHPYALMDAMMYVIISENLHDRSFIARATLSVLIRPMPEGVPANESLVAYSTGAKDGVVKSPSAKRSPMPAQTIRQLARDYAVTKPAALIQGGDHSATTAASAPRAADSYRRPLPQCRHQRRLARLRRRATVNSPRVREMPDNPVKSQNFR